MRLKSASLSAVILALVSILAICQIALGVNLVVLALALIACFAGLAAFRIAGAYTGAGWLAFFFMFGNVTLAILVKTLAMQSLDSRLYSPLESFLALAVGSMVLLAAVAISLIIPIGRPVFRPLVDTRILKQLSLGAFALGTLSWFLNRLFQDPGGGGFGGVAIFWNLLLMAVIARTALILEQSGGRRSLDVRLVVILAACMVMGLLDNAKTQIALPIVSYFATTLFYRKYLTFSQMAIGALGIVVLATLIAPMIQAYRAMDIQELRWRERAELLARGGRVLLADRRLQDYMRFVTDEAAAGHYDYFGGGAGQVLIGRYTSIQQIDPVIAQVSRHSAIGGVVIWPAFSRLLPSFIYSDKPLLRESYNVVVRLGLRAPAGGIYPTVPLLAQSYAGYGVAGLLIIPFLTFLVFLLALKKLGWNLYRNVFAIFFFCMFIVVYANQGDLGQYAATVLRAFPELAVILWLLTRDFSFRQKSQPTSLAVGANH